MTRSTVHWHNWLPNTLMTVMPTTISTSEIISAMWVEHMMMARREATINVIVDAHPVHHIDRVMNTVAHIARADRQAPANSGLRIVVSANNELREIYSLVNALTNHTRFATHLGEAEAMLYDLSEGSRRQQALQGGGDNNRLFA